MRQFLIPVVGSTILLLCLAAFATASAEDKPSKLRIGVYDSRAGVIGARDPEALPFALDLGIAMQMTNIARDVAEDARLGRVYLPETRLQAAGTSQAAVLTIAADPEAKELLRLDWGNDFGSPHETELTRQFDRPVFVYHYPTAVKAFYMPPLPDRPEVCRSVDLLAPEGYGEIIGGSERIFDLTLLEKRIRDFGVNPDHYQWYLDLRRYGSVPHAGFGLGVERTVTWICGIDHLREAVPFPRTLNRLNP